ncbi:hypothetical protein UlMin_040573 [Ulmus minor]
MRTSCNGCRVLRKGCTDNCVIRPCLQWIRSTDSQAHATLFLAKFYGRAGLLNLINAGPQHLRPAIFKSLLYEACGRILNPIYGSVGLLWNNEWDKCEAAVDSVLSGLPIIAGDAHAQYPIELPLKACDIRHVAARESNPTAPTRTRFKRNASTAELTRFGSSGEQEEISVFSAETVEASLVHRLVYAEPAPAFNLDSRADCEEVGLELTLGLA